MSRIKSHFQFRLSPAAWQALWLSACLVAFPVLPQLHMAFAGHRHHYCGQHHRYEDLVPSEAIRNHLGRPSSEPGISSQRLLIAGGHLDCPLSSLLLGNHAVPEEPVSFAAVVGEVSDPVSGLQADIRPPSVLSRAPKHSPPC